MAFPGEQDLPSDLANRFDEALKALWGGDSTAIERLLGSEDGAGPGVGELLKGVIGEQAGAVNIIQVELRGEVALSIDSGWPSASSTRSMLLQIASSWKCQTSDG